MHLYLFEDRAETLEPISLTRPVFDVRCGIVTLAEKLARHFETPIKRVLIRPALEDLFRVQHPNIAVNDPAPVAGDCVILANGRWLPPREPFRMPKAPSVGVVDGGVAYVVLPAVEAAALTIEQLPELLDHWQNTLPRHVAHGRLIGHPWDLVECNAEEIARDFAWLDPARSDHDTRLTVIGPESYLWIAPGAKIEPMVVADTTHGPVVIDDGAVISAFTRLEGPCAIGRGSQVFGAKIRAGTTLGPQCRVGGEVEASVLHGYSNKYHEGFLGHSYVGEWVNLGAGTHNSDLRNDYGEVTITMHGLPVRTGCNKVGCFMGDHTKTGLGTLINTGTNVGAFCNLLPAGRFAPKYVPSFTSWWNGTLREAFTLDQLLTTAETAMKRRGITLTDAHRGLYAWLFDDSAAERRRVMRESEQRQLRKSA